MFSEENQMSMFDPDTWSGKMSPEPSAVTKDKTSQRSLKKQSGSQSRKPPMFVCLRKDGPQADASGMRWESGVLPGEFSMHSFGEHPISLYHNGVGESHLSQILEDSPHPRYSLSAKACQGILNRANRRGKKLPEMLEKALVEQSLALSKSEEDAVGGGKGALIQEDKSATLSTLQDQTLFQPIPYGIGSYHSNAWKSDNPNSGVYEADTAKTLDSLNCGYPGCNQGGMAVVQPMAYSIENHPADSLVDIDDSGKVQTLTSRMGTGGGNVPMVMETFHASVYEDCSPPLKARDYKDPHIVISVDCRNATELEEQSITLQSSCHHNLNSGNVVRVKHIVRRLTPLECERLQGFPDGWTDIGEWVDSKGKRHKEADSPRYKALGNSIALPPWKWVLKRLCACYERDATMASLFDGIGGFPYIWEQLNGKGSCLWASEIEEFLMAVTKLRFGGNEYEPDSL